MDTEPTTLGLTDGSLYERVVNSLTEGIVLVGLGGTILACNDAAQRILGLRADEITGRLTTDERWHAIHPDGTPFDTDTMPSARTLATGEPVNDVLMGFATPDGETRWITVNTRVLDATSDGAPTIAVASFTDVTSTIEVTRALELSQTRFTRLMAGSWDIIIVIDADTNLLYATPRLEQLLGRSIDSFLGRSMIEMVHPEDLGVAAEGLAQNLAREGEGRVIELRVQHADGHWIDVEVVGTNQLDDPAVAGIVLNVRDATERKAFEATLRDAQLRFEEVFEHAPAGVGLVDVNGRFFRVNPALCRMLGTVESEMIGNTFRDYTHPDDMNKSIELHTELFEGLRRDYSIEKRYLKADGDYLWCRTHVSVVRGGDGRPQYSIGQLSDITEQKTAAEILELEARYDALTGLATRKLFLAQLERAIAAVRRHGGRLAVLFIDLDHFKHVNDTLGHTAGDELLAAVGQRLRSVMRTTDMASRFGGDEFMVLCPELESDTDVIAIAERIRTALEHPFRIRGTELFVGASIGIAIADDAADASTLLSQADSAAYRAKDRGRNRYEIFDEELRVAITQRLEVETALRHALDNDEFVMVFQPVVEVASGTVDGFEALVRWNRPGHPLVSPIGFLPVAEERGLIVPMGLQILEKACLQSVAWAGCGTGGRTPTIAVNISAKQLAHPEFVTDVLRVLEVTGAAPEHLCFEITETALMDDTVTAIATLHRLRDHGITFAIDDFGTGYSSLSYLRKVPASIVKVDQSFVAELGSDGEGSTIVASVIHLAHALGMQIVAEGVETIEHVAALVTLGCDYMQGYYFSRPAMPDEAISFMHNHAR